MREWLGNLEEIDRDCVERYEELLGRKLNSRKEYAEIDKQVDEMILEWEDKEEFFKAYPNLKKYCQLENEERAEKKIAVKYMATQGAEDLYVTVDEPKRVYVRQKSNTKDLVSWCSTSKWSGGYEADSPVRAGITMSVVVGKDIAPLFEETLEKDDWNGGTTAKKKGQFFDEIIKELATEFEKEHGLLSYEDWKGALLQDKEAHGNKGYDDNWLFGHSAVERLEQKVLKEIYVLGKKYYFMEESMKHKVSGREWKAYELTDESKEITVALCGYTFEKELKKENAMGLDAKIQEAKGKTSAAVASGLNKENCRTSQEVDREV